MLGEGFASQEQAKWREKSEYLSQANALTDSFFRGSALRGVIDLMSAGGDVEEARAVFATVDDDVLELIVTKAERSGKSR